jgi:hypothetical protein
LALALVAVADIQRQRLRGWCLEADSSALATRVHVCDGAQATDLTQGQKNIKKRGERRTKRLFIFAEANLLLKQANSWAPTATAAGVPRVSVSVSVSSITRR